MNRVLQRDVHPDAESLNAFVERALPQPERAQIVAHLGGCARCREVVFLAQAAAEADPAPAAAVTTESPEATSGRAWWRARLPHWRIALIPAAALATAAGLLIWVQMKPARPAAIVAEVAPPPPSRMPSLARSVPSPAESAAASATPPVAAQHVQPNAVPAERRVAQSGTVTLNRPAPKEMAPEPTSPIAQLKTHQVFHAEHDMLAMTREPPQQAVFAPPASINTQWTAKSAEDAKGVKQAQSQLTSIAAQNSSTQAIAPPPAPAPPNLGAVHGSLMATATAGPRPLTAEVTSAQAELMPQPVNGLAALRLVSHPRLPSGLNAISSAVMLDRVLAVDSEGSVFLSRDAAKHWERVPTQWTGKAIAVQAPPRELYPLNAAAQNDATLHTSPVASVSINSQPPAPGPAVPPPSGEAVKQAQSAADAPGPPPAAASADAALPMPGMLFKLINDRHQAWVSADGKVWHEQEGRE